MLSVVIPLYNKRPYIRRCVASVLGQTFSDFELIVVDDGSTDDGINELSSLNDPRLFIIAQQNAGEGEARNSGIRAAKGEYIAFLDADDMWFSGHLAELKKIIDIYPNAGLISTNHIECNTNNQNPGVRDVSGIIRSIDYFASTAKRSGVVWSSAAAVKSSVARVVGGFKRYKIGTDQDYWARVALDYPVAVSSKKTAIYFRGTGGAMESQTFERNRDRPVSLSEHVSPSIPFLISCMEDVKYLSKRDSIADYINSRVTSSIRGSLYRGQIIEARSLAALFTAPVSARYKVVAGALKLPIPFVKVSVDGLRALKKAFRKQ